MWQILISVPVAAEGIVEHQERTQTATAELVFDVELGSLEKKCSSTCPLTELCKPNCSQRRIKYDLLVSALCPAVLVLRSLRSDQILPSVQRQLHNTILAPHLNVTLRQRQKSKTNYIIITITKLNKLIEHLLSSFFSSLLLFSSSRSH